LVVKTGAYFDAAILRRTMRTREDLSRELRSMGCTRVFKPYLETESKSVQLQVRNPARIIDGQLHGTTITIYDQATFCIWSPQVKKAKAYAARYGLRARILNGECELFVPAHLADQLLPKFGAIAKRNISEAHRACLRANGFKLARSRANFQQPHTAGA
jgi:hypothetical protein